MCHNRSQRLIQFMRDRSRHLRQAHCPRKTRQIILRQHKVLLCTVLLLDIDVDAVPPCNLAIFRTLWNAAHEEPAVLTIGGTDAGLDFKSAAGHNCSIPSLSKERRILGVENAEE